MPKKEFPTYVVNGLVLRTTDGLPVGDFRGTWNWDGTPEGFFELQDEATCDLAKSHKLQKHQIRLCITAFVQCPQDDHNNLPVDSRAY